MKKIINYGITGKVFNVIRSIYTNNKACIKLSIKYTKSFELSRGVRQGCVLSPLLFNIFISDFAKQIELMEDKFQVNTESVNSLIWADDIFLFAKSENGLSQMLKALEDYCNENNLIINTNKTKCMIFNKTGRLIRRSFFINGVEVENGREYKYLGFLVTPSGEINSGLQDLGF